MLGCPLELAIAIVTMLQVRNAAISIQTNLQILNSRSDRNACAQELRERDELRKMLAQLVQDVYGLEAAGDDELKMKCCRWKELGYARTSLQDLLIPSVAAAAALSGTWYAIFKKSERCGFARAPEVVIAVRGTVWLDCRDLESNVKVIEQYLHDDQRYHHLKEVAARLVRRFGHANVCITGHSLGAALGLLVGKELAKGGTPVEAHLFNPPFEFATFAWVKSATLRRLERKCKLLLLCLHTMAAHFNPPAGDYLKAVRDDSAATAKWTPHLYLNTGDIISWGYLGYFLDQEGEGCRARLRRWLDRHSLLSLLSGKSMPGHRVPSALVTTARGSWWNVSQAHRLAQWAGDGWEWKSGREVDQVSFGRQISQRMYGMRREWCADTKLMTYAQTMRSCVVQFGVSTATGGFATSKRNEVVFLFSNDEDAQVALRRWPAKLQNRDINARCLQDRAWGWRAFEFEFRLKKFEKGAITFYVYSVRKKGTPFQQELQWSFLLESFDSMKDFTDWVRGIRRTLLLTGAAGVLL